MQHLFRPVNIAALVFFRVAFGILAFADLLGAWTYYHLYEDYFNPAKYHFHYIGFEFVNPFPEPFMSLFFMVLMLAALLIAAGKWYRISTIVFAIGYTYYYLLEKALYLNHGYLFCWLAFVMIFLPANRNWSGDVLKNPALRTDTIARWSLWILPFLMSVVYFFGGIAKLNADWLLEANPLHSWLKSDGDMPVLGWLWRQKTTAYVMAWSGTMLDLSAPFLLLFRKTRPWAIAFALFFHLTNTLLFQIGIFPWLSLCLSLLFFPPDFPRWWFAFLKTKIKRIEKVKAWWEGRLAKNQAQRGEVISEKPMALQAVPPGFPKKTVLAALLVFCIFHLLVPLRHHYFKGDVAWTEEGHRFAWRMMLRSKRGHGDFTMKNVQTGASEKVEPEDYLTERQFEKIFTHPDMILQFAHHLRDVWKEKGVPKVEVYAKIRVSLNGGKTQPFIDPNVDLAKEKWQPFKAADWIVPQE